MQNHWYFKIIRASLGTFMCNYFKFGAVVQEMLFERFFLEISILSSGGHFFQWSGTVCAILVQYGGHSYEIILNLDQWLFKTFLRKF